MKLLYLTSHETMEFEELEIFNLLGIDVFSIGYYLNPKEPLNPTRYPLPIEPKKDLIDKFLLENPKFKPQEPLTFKLTKEFVKEFDVILCSHFYQYLDVNWEVLKDKLVIRRSIGQEHSFNEAMFSKYRKQGMKSVINTPKSALVPNFIGTDALVRSSCDPEIFKGWIGGGDFILTVQKNMKKYPIHSQFQFYEEVTRPYKRILCGKNNEEVDFAMSGVDFSVLMDHYKTCQVYFASCSRPAPITYTFMEAWMSGAPLVSIGPVHGNTHDPANNHLFEQYEFIENGVDGFWSDDINELRSYINLLKDDVRLANEVSSAGRKKAIKIFGKQTAIDGWKDTFEKFGVL